MIVHDILTRRVVNYRNYTSFYDLVASSISNLKYLNLGRTSITDSILIKILQRTPLLTGLWLEENFHLTDDAIINLGSLCPLLTVIKLRNCGRISDAGLIPLLQSLGSTLKAIGISYTMATDKALMTASVSSTSLHTLFMNYLTIDSESTLLKCLTRLGPRLKTLSMSGIDIVTDNTIDLIVNCCHSLERLDISYAGDDRTISERGLESLQSLRPRLQNVVFRGIDGISPKFEKFMESIFETSQFWLEPTLK